MDAIYAVWIASTRLVDLLMSNILIVYHYYGQHPPRPTKHDHLFCFRRYADARCYYLNLAFSSPAWYLQHVKFDLIIFHTLFFSLRWQRGAFARYVQKASSLRKIDAVKVALPQDEFINTDMVSGFINEFGISHVFSAAPASEWPKIYAGVDFTRVSFCNVLTGYLDDATVAKIDQLATATPKRTIDIGYRAGRPDPTLGMHGYLKGEIAAVFREGCTTHLTTDISTRPEDAFLGEEWYKFLLRCKYTLGAESGSSLLDRDGALRARILSYSVAHPKATFSEIQAACFPNEDNALKFSVIGPRHLEACATRTCQVLIEGEYNGILQPGKHYIPLARDYSNLEQVVHIIEEDTGRATMVDRAYNDIVASGRYSYRSFVEAVIRTSISDAAQRTTTVDPSGAERVVYRWMKLQDDWGWLILAFLSTLNRWLLRLLPVHTIKRIKTFLAKWFLA
jgi:hypothetical protein